MLPKKCPTIRKVHFACITENRQSNDFVKYVYSKLDSNDEHDMIVVHYIYNEGVFWDFPPGMLCANYTTEYDHHYQYILIKFIMNLLFEARHHLLLMI